MPALAEVATILNRGNIALYPVNLAGNRSDTHFLGEEAAPDALNPEDLRMPSNSENSR
jgi:hypothetical protein